MRSTGASAGSAESAGSNSSSKANKLPPSGRLVTVMSPPSRRTSSRLITSPRPVPPLRRLLSLTCSNGRKMRAIWASLMPIPLSCTSKRSRRGAARHTRSRTSPWSVNLTALSSRFSSTWRSRRSSMCSAAGKSDAKSQVRRRSFFCSALTRISPAMVCRNLSKSRSQGAISNLPASIFARSRMSLIKVSRCSPLWRIAEMPVSCRSVSVLSSCRICAKPRMPFSGVRRSWLMLARNALLAWFAISAFSLAWRSASSAWLRPIA